MTALKYAINPHLEMGIGRVATFHLFWLFHRVHSPFNY